MPSDIVKDLVTVLERAARESGVDLAASGRDLALYANERAAELVAAAGEPGYDRALDAARDAVLLYAAGRAVDAADAADARLIGVVEAGLAVATRALVGD